MWTARVGPWLLLLGALCSGWAGAATDSDKSQLKTADVNSMFPGGARAQPLPLPLGPAYNNSDFNSFVNVTFQMYTDQPARAFAVNQSLLSQLVNQLGQLYYPQGVLFEVLDLVAANGNDSMVDCTLPGAGGNWGMCVSMLFMLQDDTKATFVKSTFVNVDVANGHGVPSSPDSLASALSRIAAKYGARLMWEAVPQADVMQPPLLSPVYSFWSPIPTRTRTMTAQLQGNQILPFPGYQKDASLGAIKKSLANVATYVALDGVAPSTQAAGRKLMASRTTPYVNITFDFDCFASLSLPTTLTDWQVLSPELLKDLQAAGVLVEAVQIVAVNLTTPADLVAAEATAAINAPPSPTDADRAVLNSVAAATNLTKALTDSMSQALNAFGYSPGSAGAPPQSQQPPAQAGAASVSKPPSGPASPPMQAPIQAAAGSSMSSSPAGQSRPAEGSGGLFGNAADHGKYVPIIARVLGGVVAALVAAGIVAGILICRRRKRRQGVASEKEALHPAPSGHDDPYHALMLSSSKGTNSDRNIINSLGPLFSDAGGSGTGGSQGTGLSTGGMGSSMVASGSSLGSAMSDSMKPPPGYTPAASVIAPQDLAICKKSDGSDFLLGQGTFGAVYKAMRRHVQECAVKILRNVSEDELTNFQREVYIMQQCSFDRNIVQFYGFCVSPPMLVLEFMEGGDLWSALRGPHREELQWYGRGRALALDIARGLHFLHEHKVVHADMKTKNILLSEGRLTAKIADVGLARYMAQTHMDTASLPLGTFVYAAPELLLGRRSDHKVDIYSMGIILWELVTLMTPARGNLRSVKVPEECPTDVAHLIEDCLNANNPDSRPSASDIFDRLISSAATVEEAHDRMLHPERYEKAEASLTLTPSGDTEFNTAQQAGSREGSLENANKDAPDQVATRRSSEELWDDSFKPPGTLERSNSPTSTLADRFVSAGSDWSGTENGTGDSCGAASAAPDSDHGSPDQPEKHAMLVESTNTLGKSVSLPSGDSFDSDDIRGSSATDSRTTSNPALDSTASTASSAAKQLAHLDVIREDEEDKYRQLSPGHSLHSVEERVEDGDAEEHELEPIARHIRHHSDGEGEASDCDDDDADSEASSEALALAVATGEATEEEEAAEAPKEPKFGLTRLGSLLPRRADAGQEGEPRLPGAPSLSKSLVRLGSMLPGLRQGNEAQDMSSEEDDNDAVFAAKPPLAKAASISKGWSRVGTLLPIIGHRSNSTSVNDPSSDGGSLRASFTQQTQRPTPPATPERNSFEDQTPRQDETPRSAMRLPRRPSLPGAPETPIAQPALRPNYQSSTKPASSTGTQSEHILSDSSSSPAPSRVPFSPATSTSDDEDSRAPAQRIPSYYSGYAASKELSADEAPPRIPNRPVRPTQRMHFKALRGKDTPPTVKPEVPCVPSVTIKKDVTQTLGANFWASAAGASYDSQRAATLPAAEPAALQPATGTPAPAAGAPDPAALPSARPPPIAAAAMNFWQAAASSARPPASPVGNAGGNVGGPKKAMGASAADKAPAMPASRAGSVDPAIPKQMHAPTPSKKLAASKFWEQAAERTFSNDAKPEDLQIPVHTRVAPERSPPQAAEPQRTKEQAPGGLASSGKQGSARHLAARLRQQAAVRQSSLAAVKSGSVQLKEAASLREGALRAVDENEEGDPEKSPHGKALWMRAKSMASNANDQESPAGPRPCSTASTPRIKDLWSPQAIPNSPYSDKGTVGSSSRTNDSTLSVLISDGSRHLSSLSSPFVSVVPPLARDAAPDKSDAELADAKLAQQMFRAAQARRRWQGGE